MNKSLKRDVSVITRRFMIMKGLCFESEDSLTDNM